MERKCLLLIALAYQFYGGILSGDARGVLLCNNRLQEFRATACQPKFIEAWRGALGNLGLRFDITGTALEKFPKDAMVVWDLIDFYNVKNWAIGLSNSDWGNVGLLLYEPPACSSYNYSYPYYWRLFRVVLTPFDDLVEEGGPSMFVVSEWFGPDFLALRGGPPVVHKEFEARQLCATFMNSKVSVLPGDGYAYRRLFIEFMEKVCPEAFDWFGFSGNNLPLDFRGAWFGSERGVLYLRGENMHPLGKCCKGHANWNEVSNICEDYKFVICYENQRRPGWITERIFQALFGGAVPVYWGAPNIEDYMPRGCYIDRRDFGSNEELLEFMRNFTEGDYKLHRRCVEAFYRSDSFLLFSPENFADTVLSAIFPEGYDRYKAFPGERYEMVRRAKHKVYEMGFVGTDEIAWALS